MTTPPELFLIDCPESLPKLSVDKTTWDAWEAVDQWQYVKDKAGEWAIVYHTCASTHNELTEWYRQTDDFD